MSLYPQPFLPDGAQFVHTKFEAAFPDAYVGPETDPDITLPAVIYAIDMTGQQGNGPHLWTATLTVNIVGDAATAWELARGVYAEVHSWANTRDPAFGHVYQVIDVTAPSALSDSNEDQSKTTDQYVGIFTIGVRATRP